jgi:hypothetical protein
MVILSPSCDSCPSLPVAMSGILDTPKAVCVLFRESTGEGPEGEDIDNQQRRFNVQYSNPLSTFRRRQGGANPGVKELGQPGPDTLVALGRGCKPMGVSPSRKSQPNGTTRQQ